MAYLKNREISEQMKRDREEARAQGMEHFELDEEDYQEYSDMINDQKEEDSRIEVGGADIEFTEST